MPNVSARLAVVYLMAVGIPIFVLAGVIRAGTHLQPPMSAGGHWVLETGPICGASSFTVSQSGRMLSITLDDHAAAGTVEGDTVRIRGAQPRCAVTVVARLDRSRHPHVIAGQLAAGCETCPPVSFRAVRRTDEGRSR
jgi:hypothetical protein